MGARGTKLWVLSVEETAGPGAAPFAHTALVVGADRDLRTLGPELRRSAAIYDEVLVVVGDRTRHVLADAAGDLPPRVRWGEPGAFYQRLGFAYEGFRRYLADEQRAGRRVHVIAEPDLSSGMDAGLCADRAAAYLAYEAICNDTYALGGSAVTCVWDSRHHPRTVIDGVRATHPYELTAAGRSPSPSYLPPRRYLAGHQDRPMRPAPEQVDHDGTVGEVAALSGLRSTLSGWAAGHRFTGDAREDLVLAVVEVATNGLRHGGTPVRVRAWHHHGTLIVQCDDSGTQPIPAAAGYLRPEPSAALAGGRGLWLARQLADVVTVSSVPGRTSVRLYFPLRIMLAPPS
ncbi:ATP-binding protein [Actinoplanes sp. NPDC023714]|uniref:ATP-binding protein n=1 Tax=Actinoplanes sp. NPDC023714 TaxID=3154322 RepID=UPI0033C4131F